MAKTRHMDELEASDDSISLTSTVASAEREEYEIDRILAEKTNSKGVVEYLTAWKDYPETRSLWIPSGNFNEGDAFSEWTTTKKRVDDGLQKPFDVKAWRKKCKAIESERIDRKKRRRKKRLQITKQNKLASTVSKQDENSQSLGSEPASERSHKRIKRRSVHQDLPPSSSTSIPPSSSNSEDSDRPLMSRQESEMSTANPKWTQAEIIALEDGLRRLKGPRWQELLGLYGRNGTINQVLKDKTPRDLYDKAKIVRQEFVDSGREPPEYLKPFSRPASSKGSGTATPNLYSESRGQSRLASRTSSRNTSADSLMAELHETQSTRKAKKQKISQAQQNMTSTEILSSARGQEKESKKVKKLLEREPKASQASHEPSRNLGVLAAEETLKETPKAVRTRPYPADTAPPARGIIGVQEPCKNAPRRDRQPEDGPHANESHPISALSQEHGPESEASSANKSARSATIAAAQPELPHTNILENKETTREETAGTNWSGTARAQTARKPVSKSSRSGAAGSGLIRPNPSKVKPKLGQIEPKKSSVTGDVTAAWNAAPKKRMSNNWATTNAEPVDGQPTIRKYKLSVQNRIFKSRRDGGAPDPNSLLFIDRKTGKAPISVPAVSATTLPSKTPLQLYQEELAAREAREHLAQEGLAAKEAEDRLAQEAEDAMLISTSEPDPPSQTIDQNREIRVDEQKVPDTGTATANASESAPRPMTGGMTDGRPYIDTSQPRPPASSDPGPPLNAPLGPRAERKSSATMSLQDYTERTLPTTHHSTEAVIDSRRRYSSDEASKFTLRAYPSLEHRNEILSQKDPKSVIGDIKFGEDDRESISVRLLGFGWEVKTRLLTIKIPPRTVDFVFKTVLLASEYKAYFPAEPSDYLGSGSIVSNNYSSSLAVENIVDTLANNLQGSLFFAQQYTMLIYPAGASAWAFLDNSLPSVHPGTALRFVVRKPLPPVSADIHGQATARLSTSEPERYAAIQSKVQKHPIQAEDKNNNIVFRDLFDIDFGRLVAQNGPQQHPSTKIFFLCFIPQGCEGYEPDSENRSALRTSTSEEHDLFIKFLQANGAEEIYSMQNIGSQEIDNNGAWDYFCKNIKSGAIIFHDAFIRYDLVPRLAKHLLHGSVNVWKTSLSPMHPGEKHPHLVRLFPHGGVLLLTESLILYQPRETLRLLMWFRRVHVPGKAPGTWKLALRPRVREWLLDIMDAYSDSKKDIFGYGIQIFADIYTEIYWLLHSSDPGSNRLMCHEWDYETPTDEAPIVSSSSLGALQARREWKGEGADAEPDHHNIRKNDDLLAQWFAEWAIVNLQNFRKYHIILGYTETHLFTQTAILAYEKAWGHIEVMTFEEAFRRHKVTAQSKLDDMEAERRRRLKKQLPAKKAAAAKARMEEREAAKLALEARMQMFRDVGATDEEVLRAGRQLLRDLGGSEKEVATCKVDMDRVFVDRWWEDEVKDADVAMDRS